MADVVVNEGPYLLRAVIATLALGGIFIFARTITRTVIRPQFGWDDALIIITWFLILGFNAAVFVCISRGYGKHAYDLTPEQFMSVVHAEVFTHAMGMISYPTGKASVACLLLRLFPNKRLKWILWTSVAINALLFYLEAIIMIVQCQPIAFQWDRSIPGGSCWNPLVFGILGYITGAFGATTDFVFAIIPWYFISKLRMSFKAKAIAGASLSMGVFAGICSILKTYYIATQKAHADYSFDTVPLIVWSCAELAAINVAACIPTLGPLVLWLAGKEHKNPNTPPSDRHRSSMDTLVSMGKRFSFRGSASPPSTLVEDAHDRNIYHHKTYDVSIRNKEDVQPDVETGTKTNVFTGNR